MTAILTAAEMRALEQAAIARGEVTGLELMERAGRGVVEAVLAEWPEIEAGTRRAVVLCGPGNNGGDGFVVARLLRERGWEVVVWLVGPLDKLPPDAAANAGRWTEVGTVNVLTWPVDSEADTRLQASILSDPAPTCVVVDALFGIGLTRPLGDAETRLDFLLSNLSDLRDGVWDPGLGLPEVDIKWVAVDVPSGLCADSGRLLVDAVNRDQGFNVSQVRADLTVTFHRLKLGHLLADGPRVCRKVAIVDIGLPQHPGWTGKAAQEAGPRNARLAKGTGHKYTHGHAVVLAGGCGKGGAARMAARGALRVGAGLVTLAVPPAALQENAARLDAIMLKSVRDAGALRDTLADDRLNALCAGPGLGLREEHGALVAAVLGTGRPTVLDGDALTLLAKDDALRARLHAQVVLTPHEGEFARLFPAIDAKWRAPATSGPACSKVDAARDAAREAGCVVLLKGPDTVVADPGGRAAINAAAYDRDAPWLATAGSGDVLAGFVTGLLARGFQPFDAACTAAWLHVECARSFGPGLIAEDLADELPKVLRALGP